MAGLLRHVVSFAALFTYGLHHLVAASRSHLKSRSYAAQPYHPFSLSSPFRHLPIYLLSVFLLLAALDQALLSSSPIALQRLHSLQSAVTFLFLLFIAVSLRFSLIPPDLSFLLAAAAFALRSAAAARFSASDPQSDLPALLESISSSLSAISASICISLAIFPKIFAAELALAASISLQGLWSLQTGLSLYAEAFIPEGCHKMLDLAAGSEESVRCELQESRSRAAAVLDLAITIHATIIAVLVIIVYLTSARVSGTSRNNSGTYEAISSSLSGGDLEHVQMKAIGKSTMQA